MQPYIYPVHGDVTRNLKVSILPAWVDWFLPFGTSFVAGFGRVWLPIWYSKVVNCQDALAAYDAMFAESEEYLLQQSEFPCWGIGWFLERWMSKDSCIRQDAGALFARICSFPSDMVAQSLKTRLIIQLSLKHSTLCVDDPRIVASAEVVVNEFMRRREEALNTVVLREGELPLE